MKNNFLYLITLCFIGLNVAVYSAEIAEVGPHEFHRVVLDNGLVTLAIQSTNELADIYLCVDVGKRQETSDTTGLAHLTEHILFAGTDKLGGQGFERTIRRMNGKANAYTRDDYTLYYDVQIPMDHLDEVLGMEADRLLNLNFERGAFEHERERLRKEEQGDYRVSEQLHEWVDTVVFPDHPYGAGGRIDGHTKAIGLDIDVVQPFYQRYYHPRNVALCVVSKEPVAQSLARIKQVFGDLPAGPEVKPIPLPTPIEAPVTKSFETPLGQDRVEFVWQIPGLGHPDYASLEVLGEILANRGKSGDDLIHVGMGGRIDGDHIRFWATGEHAEESLALFFASTMGMPFTEKELQQAQKDLAQEFVDLGLHSRPYFSLPARMVHYEAIKLPDFVATYAANIEAVSVDALQQCFQTWLAPNSRYTIRFEGTGKKLELPEERNALARFAADAQEAGNHEEAIEAYTRLLSYKNNTMFEVIYLASRGQIFMDAKRYDEGISDFRAAIKLSEYPALPPLLEEAERLKEEAMGRLTPSDAEQPEVARKPDPELQPELEDLIPLVSAEIETWRGLKFKTPVAVTFTNKTEGKLGGWYNSETKKLVVIVQEDRPIFSRGVLLHELTHALQDQYFDLGRLHREAESRDEQNALVALIEGEAMLAVSELMDYNFLAHAKIRDKGPITADAFTKKFHYGSGLLFVKQLRDSGGWENVDEAFKRPPQTTAEIYFPGRYPAEAVVVPEAVEGEVLGLFDVRWLLTRPEEVRAHAVEISQQVVSARYSKSDDDGQDGLWYVTFAKSHEAEEAMEVLSRAYSSVKQIDELRLEVQAASPPETAR